MSIEFVAASGSRRCRAACRAIDEAWASLQDDDIPNVIRAIDQAIEALRFPAGPESLPRVEIRSYSDILIAELEVGFAVSEYEAKPPNLPGGRADARRALAILKTFRFELAD